MESSQKGRQGQKGQKTYAAPSSLTEGLRVWYGIWNSLAIANIYFSSNKLSGVLENKIFGQNQHAQSKPLYFVNSTDDSSLKICQNLIFKVNFLCQESSKSF